MDVDQDDLDRVQRLVQSQDPDDPGALATAAEVGASKKRKKTRDVLTAEAWQYFKQGKINKKTGLYNATCNYCGKIYKMGQSKGTGSLNHHYTKGCKKSPHIKKNKRDALQRLLQVGTAQGNPLTGTLI